MISIVCPVLNEEAYIHELIEFLLKAEPEEKEIFFVDGGSTDDTIKILEAQVWTKQHVHVLNNIKKTVPYALNRAIPECSGDIIVRLDAHTKYDINYFKSILETFEHVDADIVGGPTRTAFKGNFQEAVAYAFNSKFGMGNSSVHDIDFKGYTDSVTFGAWRKSIFNTTGLFDTSLKRNQDDEFHYRARSLGFKIYQNPEIRLFYYPRNTWWSLFKQYFQYGLYKPLVLKKVSEEIKIRHLVPATFLLYLIGMPMIYFFGVTYLIPLLIYLILNIYFSFRGTKSLRIKYISLIVYPTIHIGYGIGFLFGLIKLFKSA